MFYCHSYLRYYDSEVGPTVSLTTLERIKFEEVILLRVSRVKNHSRSIKTVSQITQRYLKDVPHFEIVYSLP